MSARCVEISRQFMGKARDRGSRRFCFAYFSPVCTVFMLGDGSAGCCSFSRSAGLVSGIWRICLLFCLEHLRIGAGKRFKNYDLFPSPELPWFLGWSSELEIGWEFAGERWSLFNERSFFAFSECVAFRFQPGDDADYDWRVLYSVEAVVGDEMVSDAVEIDPCAAIWAIFHGGLSRLELISDIDYKAVLSVT